jgi:hypothetical protein
VGGRANLPAPGAEAAGCCGGPVAQLALLSAELLLCVLRHLHDYSDCVAISLASPRLGLVALRKGLPKFRHPLFAVAMRLHRMKGFARLARAQMGAQVMGALSGMGALFAEAWLRKYASDRLASTADLRWIQAHSPELYIVQSTDSPYSVWHLQCNGVVGAFVRAAHQSHGHVQHFEGRQGMEKMVRVTYTKGTEMYGIVLYYEGEQGAERLVRCEFSDGSMQGYEDEHCTRGIIPYKQT